jgi:WD40 repeat protein
MQVRIALFPLLLVLPASCGGRSSADIRLGELEQTVRRSFGPVTSLDFSPDGRWLATASMDGKVRVIEWNNPARPSVAELEGFTKASYPVAFHPDGRRLFVGGPTPKVYNVGDWNELGALQAIHSWVYHLAFSHDGRLLATAGGDDKLVGIWNADSLKLERRLSGHTDKIFAVAFDRRGGAFASGGRDRTIRVYRIVEGWKETKVQTRSTAAVMSLTMSPVENACVATSFNGEALLLDTGGYEERAALRRHADNASCAAFSRDGRFLVTGGWDGFVYLYDRRAGGPEPVRRYENRGGKVHGVAIHPDGDAIAAASDDGTIRIWRVPAVR